MSRGSLVVGDERGRLVGIALLAALARATAILWAGARFPPAADGIYYHQIAVRISQGLGATWLWPDGAVTYVSHYPIGYPALLATGYWLAGDYPVVAGLVNALVGVAASVAAYTATRQASSRLVATGAGVAVALHPGLVMYTPALMTEGVTAAFIAVATACVAVGSGSGRRGVLPAFVAGAVLGLATLIRPQTILLAPCLGLLAAPTGAPMGLRFRRAIVTTVVALSMTAPWVARNCVRMHACGVSFNGGWNLLIGADRSGTGAWAPVVVPDECKTVWDEAAKDACFGRAARRQILEDPLRWIARVPRKLAFTFDFGGAAGGYLRASNPMAFGESASLALSAIEALCARVGYAGVLLAVAFTPGPRGRARKVVAGIAMLSLLTLHGYWAVLLALAGFALLGSRLWALPTLYGAVAAILAGTSITHAVFFGSSRYAMVAFPMVTALAVVGASLAIEAFRNRPSTTQRL